ncbi:transcription termination/antitermination factor NusG, partial [Xanthomonas citri pv. citri]|nr:transcription termination/antitermination factor NusG [Xanthomonas citri pv. citri]
MSEQELDRQPAEESAPMSEDALDEAAGSGDETAEATVQEADLAVAE